MRPATLLFSALFAVFLACSNTAPETVAAEPRVDPLIARIDSFMQRNQRSGFAGSLLVMRDGEAVIDKGFGLRDREKGLPNMPSTVHAIGSITKQFTAASVLKLQEQGKLDVKDPMSKYIANVPADKASITLHHLLTHSAGFPGAIGDDNEPIDGGDFTQLAMRTPLEFPPGSGYAYSNVGYSLLGIIVEIVSGMGYERYLHDALLAPAGLKHTGYRIPDWSKVELAIGYRKDGTRWGTMLDHPLVNGGPGWHLRANGGLLSTTHDMYDWVQALATNKVLSKPSTDQMFAPQVLEGEGAESHYGFGWALFKTQRDTRLITHNGGNGIQFADVLWYADEGLTVVLMSNANKRGMQDMAWHVGRMCFDPSFEPPVPQDAKMLDGPPAGSVGERMKALSSIIGSPVDDVKLTAWLKDNLGPGFFEDFPLERHLTVFKQLHQDIGPNTIEFVQQLNAEEYEVKLRSQRDQGLFRVVLQLRPGDARIAGLGVEKE